MALREPPPAPILIDGANIVTPAGLLAPGWLRLEGGRIAALGPGTAPPAPAGTELVAAGGLTAIPGLIDIHVHGGAGADVMDADPDAVAAMARFHAAHGVTAMLPTTWAASEAAITAALRAVAVAAGPVPGGATVLGAHLEGPWISPARAGAQDPSQIRPPDREEARRLAQAGPVRIVTVAPERPGALELIAELTGRGVRASIGHTDAGHDDVVSAVEAGARLVTHTFNAMPAFGHRRPGAVGAVLTRPELACELIADNIHVHPTAMDLLARAKGAERVVLVSDAIRAAGLPDGPVDLGGRAASCCGGAVRLADGTLAGSALTLDVALANFRAATGWAWPDLARAAATNAADALGLARKGRLVPGADADVVLLDGDAAPGAAVEVRLTVALGRVVHRAG